MMELLKFVLILGAGQALLLSVLLFKRKINPRANNFIAWLYLIFAGNLALAVYYLTDLVIDFPYLIGLNSSTAYIYGPLMYFYVYTLEDRNKKFRFRGLLHYIPFLIASLIMIATLWDHSPSEKFEIVQNNFEDHQFAWITGVLAPLHVIIYIIVTYLETRQINRRYKNSYSTIEFLNLTWLNYFTIGIIAGGAMTIVVHIFEAMYDFNAMNYMFVGLALCMYAMGYISLRQPEVNLEPDIQKPDDDEIESEKKYTRSGLSEDEAENIAAGLKEKMSSEKPFLNPDLKLLELAEMLNISTHNLSQILNQNIQLSFYDFVNNYRVEEFKSLLENDPDKTQNILTLAYESGFSSKTAFYTVFKKTCGVTPTDYRKQLD